MLLKKSHAVRSDTLSPKAAASVRHDGVGPVRSGSADAGKTIVVLFVVVCALARRHTQSIFASVTQCFFGVGTCKWDQFAQAEYEPELSIYEKDVYEPTSFLDQAFCRTT